MNKFDPVEQYLNSVTDINFTLTFSHIEKLIGSKLCKSAYIYKVYWVPSSTHVLPNAIVNSGFAIASVDLAKRVVQLSRKMQNGQSFNHEGETKQLIVRRRVKPATAEEEILITVPSNLLDLENDEFLMVRINKHNSDIIEERLRKDPKYKPIGKQAFGKHYRNGNLSEDACFEIIDRIATENSTRSSKEVSRLLAKYICEDSNNFYVRLNNGEPKLVDDMVYFLLNNNQRKDKSLISKVCRYLNEWIYGKDSYTINDSFIRGALPYYLAYHKVDTSPWSGKKIEEMSYVDFFNLFDELKKLFPDLSRHQLDHLIWYSYKSDPVRYALIKALAHVV